LIRSADLFLREGLNVMMADTRPAHPNGIGLTFRLSAMHAAEVQGFINAAITRWGKPVWVVGTSNGKCQPRRQPASSKPCRDLQVSC
jgi:hypothetical protein